MGYKMKQADKDISEQLRRLERADYSEEKYQATQNAAKQSLYREEAKVVISPFEFIFLQSKYLKKRWWLGQILLLLAVWPVIGLVVREDAVKRCLGVAASIFAMLLLPEIMKNTETNSLEIECTVYYSLRRIYGARILLLAFVDLVLISAFGMACVSNGSVPVADYLIQFILPYVVSCSICFTCLYSRRMKSTAVSVLACMVWSAVWVQMVLNEEFYRLISLPVWMGLLSLACLYLGFCIYRGQKNVNKLWEAKTEWNW